VRVLIVSHHAPPMASTGTLRVASFARHLAERGDDVTILTTEKRKDQRGGDAAPEGVRVEEVPFDPPRVLERFRRSNAPAGGDDASAPSLLRRFRDRTGIFGSARAPDLTGSWIAPAARRAELIAPAGGWDLLLSSSGPYTANLVAERIADAGLARVWIADFRDLWTANPVFGGLPLVRSWERRAERRVLRKADAITTVAEPLCAWFRGQGCAKVVEIRNGYDPAAMVEPEPAFEQSDAIELVYTGTVYPQQADPRVIFQAAASIDRPVRIHVAGDRGHIWRDAASAKAGKDELILHGMLPRDCVLAMQRDAGVILVLGTNGSGYGAIPVKLLDALPMAAPVLLVGGPADAPAAELLRDAGRGRHVEERPDAIARFLADPPLLEPNPAIVRAHTRHAQASRLAGLADELLQSGTAPRS